MSRYYTQRRAVRADRWELDPLVPELSVPDHAPTDTGLVDKNGDPIMRAPNPMGFWKGHEL